MKLTDLRGILQYIPQFREKTFILAIDLVKSSTRQFAKRQLTWFRRQLDPEWIELEPDEPPENCLRNFFETVR
jgi:tRNA dimethylallyltransferase